MRDTQAIYAARMDLDTRHVRAFVAVVEEETFTDAAIALGVTQATVSRSVQRLEQALGTRLLQRTTRRVEPTPLGEVALGHARRLLAGVDAMARLAEGQPAALVMGYAWSALGEHTVQVQRGWSARGHGDLVLEQASTPTAGLLEGRCAVAVVRRAAADPRLGEAQIGTERRFAALAADHRLAGRDSLCLDDFLGETVAVDARTGSTTPDLWPPDRRPAIRTTKVTDDWLTLIASGRAVGITAEATAAQYPRPGLVYRPVRDAPPVVVRLLWLADDEPPDLTDLVELCRAAYAGTSGADAR